MKTKKSSGAGPTRARHWVFLAYPESVPENWPMPESIVFHIVYVDKYI